MKKVKLRHSKLDNREITVPESAVKIYERSGWEQVDGHTPLSARKTTGNTPPPLNDKK